METYKEKRWQPFKKSGDGFTLVELLVVIFIIGVLSAIIFPRLGGMREKARDTERITDIRTIQNAIEQHFNRRGEYPDNLGELDMSGGLPEDPLEGTGPYGYEYVKGEKCDSKPGTAQYKLSFTAEQPENFENDDTVTLLGGEE